MPFFGNCEPRVFLLMIIGFTETRGNITNGMIVITTVKLNLHGNLLYYNEIPDSWPTRPEI